MPFQIVTDDENGEGRKKKKSQPHPVLREGDMAYLSKASDLKVLLNLKVYHLPASDGDDKKNAEFSGPRRLVGEQYIQESTKRKHIKKAKAKDILNTEASTTSDTHGRTKIITLLRKIRKIKVKKHSEQGLSKQIVERVRSSSEAPKQVAAGKPLTDNLDVRSWEETFEWVIEYVNENAGSLSQTLFSVTEEVSKYVSWQEGTRIKKTETTESTSASTARKVQLDMSSGPEVLGASKMTKTERTGGGERSISLSDQLSRIEAAGYTRFVDSITPQEPVSVSPRSKRKNSFVHRPKSAALDGMPSFSESSRTNRRNAMHDTPSVLSVASTTTTATDLHRRNAACDTQSMIAAGSTNVTPPPSARAKSVRDSTDFAEPHPPQSTRPSTTSRLSSQAYHRQRQHKSKPDTRTRTYASGLGDGDEDGVILVKMGQKDMALDENTPLPRRGSDGITVPTSAFDDYSVGYASKVSTDFGSVQFPAKVEKGNTYHNIRNAGEEKWTSADLYRHNDVFDTDQIHRVSVQAYKKRSEVRDKEIEVRQRETELVTDRAETVSEKMVDAWETLANIYVDEFHQMNVLMDGKDFDRPEIMKEMRRLFTMDGEDKKLGKRGHNAMVDVQSMKRRAKHVIYCKKMNFVCRNMWFVSLLTRMRDHVKRTNHNLPISCCKFLAAMYLLIQYGYEVTHELFYNVLEQTIDKDDHKEIVVHRALKAIRDHIVVDAEVFLDYLNEKTIPPCSELLAQVRQLRLQRERAERAANIKMAIDHDAPVSFTPRAPSSSPPGNIDNPPRPFSMSELPVNKSLNLIKEYSELNDYGETPNELKTPRPRTQPRPARMLTANDVHPPTPAVSRNRGLAMNVPPKHVFWEEDEEEEDEGEEGEDEVRGEGLIRLPSAIQAEQLHKNGLLNEEEDEEEGDDVMELRLPTSVQAKQHGAKD